MFASKEVRGFCYYFLKKNIKLAGIYVRVCAHPVNRELWYTAKICAAAKVAIIRP